MKNKFIGVLLTLGLMTSCQDKEKKGSNSNSESKANIEFIDDNGNKISKAELATSTGAFNYEIYGIDNVSTLAKTLHSEARQFGQVGDYKNAIEKLKEASKEAPSWAYPLYDLAYTYLLQDDYENALKYYQLTDKLAPKGFYTSKTALHTLEREKKGDLQRGLYKSYLMLEWIDNQVEKNEMIKLFVQKFPTFAPAWKDYSSLLENTERLDAINNGLEQTPDMETKGMLLINKALVINEEGDFKKASKILTNIILNSNSTFGNIEMAKFVLNSISEEQ